jgi:hypothetical protein
MGVAHGRPLAMVGFLDLSLVLGHFELLLLLQHTVAGVLAVILKQYIKVCLQKAKIIDIPPGSVNNPLLFASNSFLNAAGRGVG